MTLTKEAYAEKVQEIATAILTECSAEEWKLENEDAGFYDFVDHAEYDGSYTSVLDAVCGINDYMGAIDILQVTEQDPDDVDPGMYEGCNWKRILICIAFEVLHWDVNSKAEDMFNDGDFPREVLAYPDTPIQRGFFPNNKKFKIPDAPYVIGLGNGVKILIGDYANPELSIVFEGKVEQRGTKYIKYIVDCRRVYSQTGSDIEADLERCKEEFGARETK